MDAKENLLRAIRREAPEYVPWSVPREYPEFRHLDEGVIEEVERETVERLQLFAPGGSYIAAPDQGMPFPMENVEVFVNTVRGYGRYPLRLA